jgi:hypothetical protein
VIKVLVQIRVWSMNAIYVYAFLFFMYPVGAQGDVDPE